MIAADMPPYHWCHHRRAHKKPYI